jgi:hypothetical protein
MPVVSGENLSTDRGRMFKDFCNRVFAFPCLHIFLYLYGDLLVYALFPFFPLRRLRDELVNFLAVEVLTLVHA